MSEKGTNNKRIPGCIMQRDKNYRVIRLRILAGNINGDQMKKISDIAEKYGRGYVGLTTRLGIEIPWVPADSVSSAIQELKDAGLVVGSTGATVRSIVACKGTICVYGLGDTQLLCRRLDEAYFGLAVPAKFKIGIVGCPNNCAKAQLNDLGFMGQCVPKIENDKCIECEACISACKVKAIAKTNGGIEINRSKCINCGSCICQCPTGALSVERQGFGVYLGGRFGREYRMGKRVKGLYTIEEAVELTGRILDYYKNHAEPKERFGDMVERLGFDNVVAQLGMSHTE